MTRGAFDEFADYCGCCGNPCVGDWCCGCASHVTRWGPPWERTYFAQHDKECPFTNAPPKKRKPKRVA